MSLASILRSEAYEILLLLREQSRPILYTQLKNKTCLDRGLFAHYLKMLKQNNLIKENYNKINQEKYGYTLTPKSVELLNKIENTILAYKQISKEKVDTLNKLTNSKHNKSVQLEIFEQLETFNR